jgi:hypothetical protein
MFIENRIAPVNATHRARIDRFSPKRARPARGREPIFVPGCSRMIAPKRGERLAS